MAIIDRVKAAVMGFTNPTQQVANKLNQAIYQFFSGYFYTLPDNKKTYLDEGYRKNLDVYSIIRLIAGKSADAHLKGVKYDAQGEEVELPKTDYLQRLLKKPNDKTRQQQFIEECLSWLLLTGDLYLYKVKTLTGANVGKVSQIWCLPSQYVQIIGGGQFDPISGYKMIIGDQEVKFDKSEVVHLKYFNPNFDISGSQLYGQSPLQAAALTIQSSNEGVNAKTRAFINGGMHGLLSSKDPNNVMTVEQISQLNDLIKARVTGTDNTKKITATNGMVEYTQIGMSPADLEILKSIQFDANALCKIFGIDPILFNTDSASYNNKKEAYKALVNNVVTPLLNLYIDALNEVVEDGERYIVYDISHFPELQADLKEQVDSLVNAYWITPNEKRKKMNMAKIEEDDMDKIYIPSNLVPIDEVSIDINLPNNGDFND
jgi:HK97 family phage portal protein